MTDLLNHQKIRDKIANGEKLRVLFLNDLGFQYGAGIAFLRQVQSFLLMGHAVEVISWVQSPVESGIPFSPGKSSGQWLGLTVLSHLHTNQGISQSSIIDNIVLEIKLRSPDVIIVGNLHGAKWPLRLLPTLQSLGITVIAFMHDCYLATGRCAYTGDCSLYETGCNSSCPTWNQYPILPLEQIFDEWALRREIFCGSNGIPLVANSLWTQEMAQKAFRGLCKVDCIYYGLDEQIFKPIDKSVARHLLGVPQDRFVILGGAVDMKDYRKGGHIFREVVAKLSDKAFFLVFGAESKELKDIRVTGFLRDYRKMPLVFSAADLFVGTSLEEAFGQTFCEASACSVPSVAFKIGGIPEIARHNVNARLANDISAKSLLKEIEFFMQNPEKRQAFGQAGRALVEEEFTLQRQGERWMKYLESLALTSVGALV